MSEIKKISFIITHLVSMALFIVMIVFGIKFAFFIRMQITPALQIPKWIILSIIPISGFILLVHGITFLVNELKRGIRDN